MRQDYTGQDPYIRHVDSSMIEMRKYNFNKQELENKLLELKTITKVAEYYNVPRTSMSLILKQRNIFNKKINENFFSKDTQESFYLAGFLAADGNVDKNLRRITIGLAEKDLIFLNKIKTLIEFKGNLTKSISHGSKRSEKYKDTTAYFLRFSSKQVADDLTRFNIVPCKTKIYDFPEWLIDHPLVHHFMRGYFDGDGCLRHDNKQLSFSLVGNKFFLEKFQNILEKQCYIKNNKISKDRNIFKLKYCGNKLVPKICEFLYNNSTFHLDRKYYIYKNMVSK